MKINSISIIIVLAILSSCGKTFDTEQSVYKWLDDKENGLYKSKDHSGIRFDLKVLPNEFMIYQEVEGEAYTSSTIDSLKMTKKDELFCLLLIDIDKKQLDNPLFKGVSKYKDYKQRIYELNFNFNEYFSLIIGGNKISPKIWNFEDLYTLGNKRKVIIGFSEEEMNDLLLDNSSLRFVFEDEIFNTGTNYFKFKTKAIKDLPEVNFWRFSK